MKLDAFFSQQAVVWVLMPALIFIAGLAYVSLGTLRIIFIAKGRRLLSPIIGFLEVSIWLIAIGQVMTSVNNIGAYFAYAAGFAVGNYAGIILEEKMAMGILVIRIIITQKDEELRKGLIENGFGVTTVEGYGATEKVKIIFTIVRRKDLAAVISIIKASHTNAFYSIEDARGISDGIFLKRKQSF